MADIKEIREELDDIHTIHTMSGVLRDIAARRTKKLRDQFQRNVSFYTEIRDLYAIIRGLMRQQSESEAPPKSAWGIVVTSNYRFYGGLNRHVTEYFLEHFDRYEDHLVVGSTGGQYIGQTKFFNQCDYKSFKDDIPNPDEMRELTEKMKEYDRVDIYYPAYKDPFHQEPTVFDINADPTRGNEDNEDNDFLESFITEPALSKLNDFFSTHVKWVLFKRVLLETDLARTSARLMKMNSAEEASSETIEDLTADIRRSKKAESNKELLDTIIALKQWQKAYEEQQ